ncbi:hypothetical protein [Nocardioides ultimimeridianus]
MITLETTVSPPAGGAPTDQILIAFAMCAVLYLPLAWFVWRESGGHPTVIGRVADWCADKSGLARWAALPFALTYVSLLSCGFGVYWDVPTHMQKGRDPGPLANPSHYPILLGILLFLMAGVMAATLARQDLPRRTLKITSTWRVPMAPVVLTAAGLIAALGFPLDDVWHRLFGQDVTEWGPTHTMMIGGAVTSFLSLPLFLAESAQAGRPFLGGRYPRLSLAFAMGSCIIPTAFLMEFDLGIPQFPEVTLYIISALLTGWIFVGTRIVLGRGGALFGWSVYVVIRLAILAMTAPLPHIHHARFLLYLGAAIVIELVAMGFKKHGAAFAATAGALAGAIGMLTEQVWMKVFMPIPLPPPADHLPFLLAAAAVSGLGAGLLGLAWATLLLRTAAPDGTVADAPGRATTIPRWIGTGGVLTFLVLMGIFAVPRAIGQTTVSEQCGDGGCVTTFAPVGSDTIVATVHYLDNCVGQDRCLSKVQIEVTPADAADNALWFDALAWQGERDHDSRVPGSGVLATRMVSQGEGVYETADPVPLYGNWKTMVRLHRAPSAMVALPLHFPADPSIKSVRAGLVQVADGTSAPFIYEPSLLQRERRDGVPGWLWGVMYGTVLGAWVVLLALYGWCYVNAGRGEASGASRETRTPAGSGVG